MYWVLLVGTFNWMKLERDLPYRLLDLAWRPFICVPFIQCLILFFILFLQTEVRTVICGNKELKKLADISGQLDTVKLVICMDVDILSNASSIEQSGWWKIISFAGVQSLGRENPIVAELPAPADIVVIMYTSGSTGLPKVKQLYLL